jgi:hypothetical protein
VEGGKKEEKKKKRKKEEKTVLRLADIFKLQHQSGN